MNTYQIAIHYETVMPDDYDDDFGLEHELHDVDEDELKREAQRFNITEASDSYAQSRTWFKSATPVENANYFERGVETYYTLHIDRVNGQFPTARDIVYVAQLLGIDLKGPMT